MTRAVANTVVVIPSSLLDSVAFFISLSKNKCRSSRYGTYDGKCNCCLSTY